MWMNYSVHTQRERERNMYKWKTIMNIGKAKGIPGLSTQATWTSVLLVDYLFLLLIAYFNKVKTRM